MRVNSPDLSNLRSKLVASLPFCCYCWKMMWDFVRSDKERCHLRLPLLSVVLGQASLPAIFVTHHLWLVLLENRQLLVRYVTAENWCSLPTPGCTCMRMTVNLESRELESKFFRAFLWWITWIHWIDSARLERIGELSPPPTSRWVHRP